MNKMFMGAIIFVWGILAVLNLVVPSADFSEQENRYLASWPAYTHEGLLDGSFMRKVEVYLNDRFVGRDLWVEAKSDMEYLSGKRENNGVFIGGKMLLAHIEEPSEDKVAANIGGIKRLAEVMGRPVYMMLAPSSAAVVKGRLPNFAPVWDQDEFAESVFESLGPAAVPLRVAEALREHGDEYIYYRTDHHWTTYGAYLAYRAAAPQMGLEPRGLEQYSIRTVTSSFNGTLYSSSGVRFIEPDIIEAYDIGGGASLVSGMGSAAVEKNSVYFDEYLAKKDKYCYFLGSNQPIVEIKTTSESPKKLLVFKDSYAHSFATLLLEDYCEIVLLDMRYLTLPVEEIVDLKSFDDVLVLYSIDTFAQGRDLAALAFIEDK